MSRIDYHGSFEHPRRAFALGVGLIVLLFGGFVAGIELGQPPGPGSPKTTQVLTEVSGKVRVVTLQQPVTTVVNGRTRVIRVPGDATTRVVVIRQNGERVLGYIDASADVTPDDEVADSAARTVPVTVYVPPETITETVTDTTTIIETTTVVETVTVPTTITVTEPPTGSDSTPSPTTEP